MFVVRRSATGAQDPATARWRCVDERSGEAKDPEVRRPGRATLTAHSTNSRRDAVDHSTAPRRVVIGGSGFGGLFAAKALKRAPVEVTLVSRTPHLRGEIAPMPERCCAGSTTFASCSAMSRAPT
ncbi:MAG: NAD(P)-binding protein [Actinomycetes bacterium]